MIAVRKYKAFWDYIATQITEITRVLVVDDESELAKKISDIEDKAIFLVAVIPFADLQAMDEDNLGDVDTCVMYILQKVDPRDENEEDIMTERSNTQELMNRVRRLMLDLEERCDGTDQSRLMKQVVRGKQHIDRERNYLGCNGYSLSFGIKTNGI